MSSKLRLVLAGLTAAALIGGVMVADPADAGKKKKKRAKAKSSKSVKQVSKGGNAKGGNGGNGGNGGKSGNVYNTGNVGGGGGTITPGEASCVATQLAQFVGQQPTGDDVLDALVPACFPTRNLPARAFQGCLQSAGTLTADEIADCIGEVPVATPGSGGGGSVFSGDGGAGASGGSGGTATGGAAGDNSNTSTVTVNRDDHSIDVD